METLTVEKYKNYQEKVKKVTVEVLEFAGI